MSDRATQDAVIRALADAPYRRSAEWRDRDLADAERVERYARFLARHFYLERVIHFFKYSRALATVTGRRPEAVVAAADFEALFPTMALGSRETARAVAALVAAHILGGARDGIPYLDELVRYEVAMLVAEAGPRVWREDERATRNAERGAVVADEAAVLLDLQYDLPQVLPQLLQPWTTPPACPRAPTRLLVARSRHGRVAVAVANEAVASVLRLSDGSRSLAQVAREAGLRPAEVEATLEGLVELGAVRFSTGS